MEGCDAVVNFAAETHVDRSLLGDASFIETDVRGVFVLLEEAKRRGVRSFVQISTDEVYGTIAVGLVHGGLAAQSAQPVRRLQGRRRSPRLLLLGVLRDAGHRHAGLQQLRALPVPREARSRSSRPTPSTTSRCRSTATARTSATGSSSRTTAAAIDFLLDAGRPGETYNIAGGNEAENIQITRRVLAELGKPESLIRFVDDRPGHDRRYSLDASKLARLGFSPSTPFEEGLSETVRWYRDHEEWWRPDQGARRGLPRVLSFPVRAAARDLVRDRQGARLT